MGYLYTQKKKKKKKTERERERERRLGIGGFEINYLFHFNQGTFLSRKNTGS
jgi:hypothetical protein